jgi:hypothetical protein
MQIHGKTATINSVEGWFEQAPPKQGVRHWVDGGSAKELAKAWCGSGVVSIPSEIVVILNSSSATANLEIIEGWPERKVRFDGLRGEPRNTDLALLASDAAGRRIAISVEAKAKEPFDDLVDDLLMAAAKQIGHDKATNLPMRIQLLARALLPPFEEGHTHIGQLRYQLLTATAGALAFANEVDADDAVLLIHEFVPRGGTPAARSAMDLNTFVERLTSGRIREVEADVLYGPFRVRGTEMIPASVALWLGKVGRAV